jgi:hypothetical protein
MNAAANTRTLDLKHYECMCVNQSHPLLSPPTLPHGTFLSLFLKQPRVFERSQ